MLRCAALRYRGSAQHPLRTSTRSQQPHAAPSTAVGKGSNGPGGWGWEGVPVCAIPGYALGLLQTKALIDKLQKLVSSEGRFKNLREALKK